MRQAAAARLACALTGVICFLSYAYGKSTCSVDGLLSSSLGIPGGRLLIVPSGCSLLGSSKQPLVLNTSLTLQGDLSKEGSLDTEFLTDAVVFTPGTNLTLQNLRLLNVRLGLSSFLSILALNTSQLVLSYVTIDTDCLTLSALSELASVADTVRGRGYLSVKSYTSRDVRATAVNITCDLPAVSGSQADSGSVIVADSLQLYNVLAAYATNASELVAGNVTIAGPLIILASQNITISPAVWSRGSPLLVTRNTTLWGRPDAYNMLDLQAIVSAIDLGSGVMFNLEHFVIVNAGPLRKSLQQPSILPCFSALMWFFEYVRIPTSPQLTLTNCTLLLPPSEYQYFTLWTVLATTPVANDLGSALRATTVQVNFTSSTNETMRFGRLVGTGIDMINGTLTFIVRAAQNPGLVLDNPLIMLSFGNVPNMTVVPAYDLADVATILGLMQSTPVGIPVALCVLQNITIDPRVWPAGGYDIKQSLLLVGQSNAGRLTWINFQRTQHFVRFFGCPPANYVYLQGLHLLNLPDGLPEPEETPLAGVAVAGAAAAGVSDVSIYLTNFKNALAGGCPRASPPVFLNQSTLLITYTEFRLVHNMVMRSLGTSTKGNGTAVGSSFTYDLSSVVVDNIYFLNVLGWGWTGFKVNMTYRCPADVPLLYDNLYEPLAETPRPDVPPAPPVGNDDGLRAWQIALIVLGVVLFVALLASLVAWRVSVRRLRHEVEAVKSGNTDKKSSNGSADQDTPSAGGRPGSSVVGGGGGMSGSEHGNGDSAAVLAKAAKGLPNGGGTGGGGAVGGGASDDSAAAQYDKPPLEVLNNMMATLAREMEDQHLTILEVVGQGGFGVVYRGMWKGLNVAVKTITFQDRVAGGEKAQHRAILEAAISSSLSHPNVVTTYSYDIKPLTVQGSATVESSSSGTGQSGGGGGLKIIDKRAVLDWKLYLIQEYCDGGSLRTAILKRKFFDGKKGDPRMEMLLDTCLELTGGLLHLHERNIIHGDLNPNNVLLKRDASKKYGAICKLADFGLSIKMSADQSHISNMRRGTPFYTCPQILARGNMTKAADVYSMGVMMWEMYHCCMSYRSLPTGFVAREIFPHFPRKAPHSFALLVGSCLDSEPSRRPTFAQLRSELEAQLLALKRGEIRTGEDVLGPDPAGDAAHLAACQD